MDLPDLKMAMAKVIHTADWHLGARLIEHDRYEEHDRFLNWLVELLKKEEPELLVVAGDIFDSANPPQAALAQYYHFLSQVILETPTQLVIVGGNHDSGALLDAPKRLLKSLRVHVIGSMPEKVEDCIFEFPSVVIAAVPFLRERDVRQGGGGQQYDEVATQIREGIHRRYKEVLAAAQSLDTGKPIIATAHLTAIGVSYSGSERDIHIGNLGAIEASCFDGFDYVALGHIHRPQKLGNSEVWRYSGSPFALNFDESKYSKQVIKIDIQGNRLEPQIVVVPEWRKLRRFQGSLKEFSAYLEVAASEDQAVLPSWLEVTLPEGQCTTEAQNEIREQARKHGMKILKILAQRVEADVANTFETLPSLEELTPLDVFKQKLARSGVTESVDSLTGTFVQLLSRMQEEGQK